MSLKRSITIVFITLLAVGISAAEPKYFQFSPKEKGNSYISADVGTQAGLSLISGSMQLGFAYSLVEKNSFYITTDFLPITLTLFETLNFKCGVGGGILFIPNIDNFESFAILKIPFILEYKNFFLKFFPVTGASMFERNYKLILSSSVYIGYKFDLFIEK